MKSVEIVLTIGEGGRRMMEGVSLTNIVSTYVNITMNPSVQLINTNEIFKIKKQTYKMIVVLSH
jgi:hypothetical protein